MKLMPADSIFTSTSPYTNVGRVDILERQYLGSAVFIYSDRFHTENLNERSINGFSTNRL